MGCGTARKGAAMGEEALYPAAPSACQSPSYPLLMFILIWSQHCQLYPLQLCLSLGGSFTSVCLFVQMPHDTVHSWAACSCPTKGHEPPTLTKAVPPLKLHPLPLLHNLLTATTTGAFLAGAGARSLTQQCMAGLAKHIGLPWAGASLEWSKPQHKQMPWGFARRFCKLC